MSILVVDDEDSTRSVLREFLTNLGHDPVLEASDGEDALRVLDGEKNPVEAIISDWEMPGMNGVELAKKVADRKELDSTLFLLISSESTAEEQAPRIDGRLDKPFQASSLKRALFDACAHRAESRDTVIYLGNKQITGFQEAMRSGHLTYWKDSIQADSVESLDRAVQKKDRNLGAIIVEAESCSDAEMNWLQAFRNSPAGPRVLLICLSRHAEDAIVLGTASDFFLKGRVSFNGWHKLIEYMAAREKSRWLIRDHSAQLETKFSKKDFRGAQLLVAKMLESDPGNPAVLMWTGKVSLELGERAKAMDFFERSLEVYPFGSAVYLELLKLHRDEPKSVRQALARRAAKLCPDSSDAFVAAAESGKAAAS